MSIMPTTTFTTRIDKDLKARLEKIAKYDNRSASFVANEAIRHVVEEREATHELVNVGLAMIDKGVGMVSREAVDEWLNGGCEGPFPQPDVKL